MSGGVDIASLRVLLGGAAVLDDLHLHVPAGERVAIVGASGAGKTTLLRAIAGLTPIDAGRIRIDDRDVSRVPAHERQIGMVFQEPRLLPHLSVVDNIALPLRAHRMSRGDRRRRALAMLDGVGVVERAMAGPDELSGGERQRVSLARALVHDPSVLILDEPLSAVDATQRGELQQLILEIQQRLGMTMLVVTHDRDEAAELGASTAVLIDGAIVQHAEHAHLAMRPSTPDVGRLIGSGVLVDAGSQLAQVLGLAPERAHWVPAPALSLDTSSRLGGAVTGRVVQLRMGAGGWIATVSLPGASAQLAVGHSQLAVGDQIEVAVVRDLITTFEEGAR